MVTENVIETRDQAGSLLSLDEVMSYQNPDVIHRYMDKLEMNEDEAKLLFEDTKRFLYLCGTFPGRWSPPAFPYKRRSQADIPR